MADIIEQLLDAYHAQTLLSLAYEAGIITPSGKKPAKGEIVQRMRTQYFTKQRIQSSLAKLGALERNILNRIQLHGGEVTKRQLSRELLRAKLVVPAPELKKDRYGTPQGTAQYAIDEMAADPNRRSSFVQDVLARLTFHGLVFSKPVAAQPGSYASSYTYKFGLHPADTLFIPGFVLTHLPEPVPVQTANASWQPTRVERGDPTLLLRDLYLYWDFVRRTEVPLLQSGYVSKRMLKQINQTLLVADANLEKATNESETPRLHLLHHLLTALKLLSPANSKLAVATTRISSVPEFWRQPQAQQLQACVEAWLTLTEVPELDVDHRQINILAAPARRGLRDALLALPHTWLEPEELFDSVSGKDPSFLIGNRSQLVMLAHYGSAYFAGRYIRDSKELNQKLEAIETAFIRKTIEGFLFQCGLVELGFDHTGDSRWQMLRLTRAGVEVLSKLKGSRPGSPTASETADLYAAPELLAASKLVIQPNFQVLAIGPVSIELLAQLDLFAERRKADVAVFEYHLSRDSVYRGLQAGIDVDTAISFLRQHGGTELPQNVLRSLQEWGTHHERITFRTDLALLHTAGDELLERLLAHPEIGRRLEPAPAPGIALVKAKQDGALVNALLAEGLLPAVSNNNPASADQSVVIDASGAIRPVHAVPSLYLQGRLARLAECEPDGRWRLTPTSVRTAARGRAQVLEMLQELRRLHRGELPDEVQADIKRWGNYYGAAGVETLTLIEFGDPKALEDLLQHPLLGRWLARFSAGERVLALLPAEQLAYVEQILRDLGVDVEPGLKT